jgi:hypothetical protein
MPDGRDPCGMDVVARNGRRLGAIRKLLAGAGEPPRDYAVVQTGGWPFHKEYALPLDLITFQDGRARVPVTKDRFAGAPEWREGDVDFYRFRNYWQPPIIGGSETISDADVVVGEEITGTMYSGTDLDTPAERAANTLRLGDAAPGPRG